MCTNFKYPTAKDGTVCVGRTMEFPNEIPWDLGVAASDHKGQSMVVPNGKTWQAKYGVVGMSGFNNPQWFADGMNTAGLSAHLLYMPDHATYYDPKGDGSDIGILDVIAFVLGTCSTLDEAKAAIMTCNVVNVNPKELPIPLPVHVILHDKNSCVVAEFHPRRRVFGQPGSGGHERSVHRLAPDERLQLPELLPQQSGAHHDRRHHLRAVRAGPGFSWPARRWHVTVALHPRVDERSVRSAAVRSERRRGPEHPSAARLRHRARHHHGTRPVPLSTTPELTIWSIVANLTGQRYLYNTYTETQWYAIDLASTDFTTSRSVAFAQSAGIATLSV